VQNQHLDMVKCIQQFEQSYGDTAEKYDMPDITRKEIKALIASQSFMI